MIISHVVPSIEVAWGGPAVSLAWMIEAARRQQLSARVISTEPRSERVRLDPADEFLFPASRNSFFHVRGLIQQLMPLAVESDVFHLHGLWGPLHLAAALAARSQSKPYILRTCGALDPWMLKRKAWKKAPYRVCIANRILRGAAAIHVVSELEARSVSAALQGVRTTVVPHALPPEVETEARSPAESKRSKSFVFLGRLSPQKGLAFLLQVWGAVQDDLPEWEILLGGGDYQGFEGELRRLARDHGLRRIRFLGQVSGEKKRSLLRSASCFVFPSNADNFGVAVLEAAAFGVPVVVSDKAPWGEMADMGGGECIPRDAKLWSAALLDHASMSDEDRAARGRAARQFALEHHSLRRTSKALLGLYGGVVGGV